MRAAGSSRGAHRSEISFHNFPRQYTGKRVETKPTDDIKRLPLIRLLCRHLPPRGKAGNNNAPAGCLLKSRHCRTAALAKKISQKDFLRRGAASVLSAAFGAAEPPARCAPPRRRQFEKNFVKYLTSFSSSWSWKAKVLRAFPSRRHGRAGCGRFRWAEHPLRATPLPSPRRQ